MNFSTNQVTQLHVLGANSAVTQKVVKTPDGGTEKAVVLDVDGDRSDILPIKNIMSITTAKASDSSQQLHRRGVLVALNSAVNGGAPVPGQDYVIRLEYRGVIDGESAYFKHAEAHAVTGTTAAQLLQALAASFLAQESVEATPLYELYNQSDNKRIVKVVGTASKECLATAVTDKGFYIVEPKPYWALGKFPETLMNISISTPAITTSADIVPNWLASYDFVAVDKTPKLVDPIYNSHKVADLEYFCKGERGISAGLSAPYDVQIPLNLKVDASAATGYDILTIHYAFIGNNTSNQRSERDLVLVAPGSGNSLNTKLAKVKTDLEALIKPAVTPTPSPSGGE